jgi:hypothetical protein
VYADTLYRKRLFTEANEVKRCVQLLEKHFNLDVSNKNTDDCNIKISNKNTDDYNDTNGHSS